MSQVRLIALTQPLLESMPSLKEILNATSNH